jgi:hypothetical protein
MAHTYVAHVCGCGTNNRQTTNKQTNKEQMVAAMLPVMVTLAAA